jgi:hypothetical protein
VVWQDGKLGNFAGLTLKLMRSLDKATLDKGENAMVSSTTSVEVSALAHKSRIEGADGRACPVVVKRILAAASGGGHWVQLCRLMPAFHGHEVTFLTTRASNRAQVGQSHFRVIRDANLWHKFGLCRMALQIFWILLRERPDVIISTGAAIGYFSIRIGKFLGARTIWVDSIANVDKLSLSGRHIGRHADLWLTQWPHLAQPNGPQYVGAVL